MREIQNRPWLAGLVVGIPIALVAYALVSLLPSLRDIGPGVGPAAAIGIVLASMVMAELAAHRHVRPWLAVVAWIGVAHAIASIVVLAAVAGEAEAGTLAASFGVLFGLVLVLVTMAVPWVVGGILWLVGIRRLSAIQHAPTGGPPAAGRAAEALQQDRVPQAVEPADSDASTAEATAAGS